MKVTGSLQKRKGFYYAFIRVLTNNGEVKQISKSTGIRVVGKTKRENNSNLRKANKFLEDLIIEYEEKESLQSEEQLIVWIDEWLQRKKKEVKLNTWEAYEVYYRVHLKPFFEPLKLQIDEVTPRIVQRYINTEYNAGQSAKSIQKYLTVLNGTFETACDFGAIRSNPCDHVKLPRLEKHIGKAYTKNQVQNLLKAIDGLPCQPAVMLGIYLGLRRSEALGLRWADIDFEHNVVKIRNTVVRTKTLIESETTKSKASRRDLYLMQGLKNYLIGWKQRQEKMKQILGDAYQDTDGKITHVCTWPNGRQLHPDYLTRSFRQLLKKNGLPGITFHELRHTCGSLMINAGISMKEVQEYLGHENVSTTLDIYTHLSAETKIAAGKCIDQLLCEERS